MHSSRGHKSKNVSEWFGITFAKRNILTGTHVLAICQKAHLALTASLFILLLRNLIHQNLEWHAIARTKVFAEH